MSLVACRLMIRHAASLLDSKDAGATMACAMAKRTATDIGFQVGEGGQAWVRGRAGGVKRSGRLMLGER